jgi:hypothetical protein
MADVTGHIGNQPVELNNAATELTLKALLAATTKDSKVLLDLAKKAGINSKVLDDVERASKNTAGNLDNIRLSSTGATSALTNLTNTTSGLNNAYKNLSSGVSDLIGNITDGTNSFSKTFTAVGKAFPLIQGFTDKLAVLIRFQEENFKSYQQITQGGVSFAGSLTDLRVAMGQTYLTMSEFTTLMTNNSDTLARMGGTVDQGAKSFVGLSNSLLRGKAGEQLLALGYTTEQVNQGMLNYIRVTGGRSREELQNTEAITAASAEYLTQLDLLAKVTGTSKEALQKEAEERANDSVFQSALANASEDVKKQMTGMANNIATTGSKGAQELYRDFASGLTVPMTAAGRELQGRFPELAAEVKKAAIAAKNGTLSEEEQRKSLAKINEIAATEYAAKYAKVGNAIVRIGGEAGKTTAEIQQMNNKNMKNGNDTYQGTLKNFASAAATQEKIMKSQADAMGRMNLAMKNLTDVFLQSLAPVIALLTPLFNSMATALNWVVNGFSKLSDTAKTMVATFVALGAAMLAYKAVTAATTLASKGTGIASTFLTRGSPGNPLFVFVENMGALGGGGAGGGRGKVDRDTRLGRNAGTVAESAIEGAEKGTGKGIISRAGNAIKGAGKFLSPKGIPIIGTAIGGMMLYSELDDINEQKKSGAISENEATKKKGGAVGGAAGGAAGAWGGAAAGGALGATLFGIGAVPGAIIGGIVGGLAGSILGDAAGSAVVGNNDPKISAEKERAEKEKIEKEKEKNKKDSEHSFFDVIKNLTASLEQLNNNTSRVADNTQQANRQLGGLNRNVWSS